MVTFPESDQIPLFDKDFSKHCHVWGWTAPPFICSLQEGLLKPWRLNTQGGSAHPCPEFSLDTISEDEEPNTTAKPHLASFACGRRQRARAQQTLCPKYYRQTEHNWGKSKQKTPKPQNPMSQCKANQAAWASFSDLKCSVQIHAYHNTFIPEKGFPH